MKKHLFSLLQRIGQSFMLPIALLPIAGIFLGIGSSLTNTNMLAAYHLKGLMGPRTAPYILFSLLNSAGSIIFDNLPILFAVGVAIGMARSEKSTAALSSIVAFFVMHSTIGSLITYTGRSPFFSHRCNQRNCRHYVPADGCFRRHHCRAWRCCIA